MKGQYFSFDAIVASVIFVLALMALLSYWHSVRTYLDYQTSDVQKEAVRLSNLLFAPPEFSSPTYDCDTIERMGFSNSWTERVVNQTLLDCAESQTSADPEWLKRTLATPYNVSITVTHILAVDDERLQQINPITVTDDTTEIVSMRRLTTVQDADGTHLATVDLRLYR